MINNDGKNLFATQKADMQALTSQAESGLGSFVHKNIENFESLSARYRMLSSSVGVAITPRSDEFTTPTPGSDSSTPTMPM